MILLPLLATVSLGPAALTYPELAAALTKAGMPTEASPSLKSRAAYVLLRDRSPEAVRRVLGEALGVGFEWDGRRWRMRADEETKAREARFLGVYRRVVAANLRKAPAVAEAWAGGRTYSAARQRLGEIDAKAHRDRLGDPYVWTDLHALNAPEASAAINGRVENRAPFGSLGIPASSYALRRFDGTKTVEAVPAFPPETPVLREFLFDPRTGVLRAVSTIEARRGKDDGPTGNDRDGWSPLVIFGGRGIDLHAEGESFAETFAEMGPEAKAYSTASSPTRSPPARRSKATRRRA